MFEITITEITEVRKPGKRQWVQVGTKEVDREPGYYRDLDKEPKTRIEAIHGYAPEIEEVTTEKILKLQQVVDDLDFSAVVRAINRL